MLFYSTVEHTVVMSICIVRQYPVPTESKHYRQVCRPGDPWHMSTPSVCLFSILDNGSRDLSRRKYVSYHVSDSHTGNDIANNYNGFNTT